MREDFPPESGDPIEFDQGKWWFWDECWADRYGPFDSHDAAERELRRYVEINLAPQPKVTDPGPPVIIGRKT